MKINYATIKDLDYLIKNVHVESKKIIINKIKSKEFFIAFEEGKPVGRIMFQYFWEVIPYIELIFVEKNYRNKGIARKLLESLEKEARKRKSKYIISSCVWNEKEPQFWHKKVGFEKKGYIDGIQPEGREVFFVKKLKK